MAPIYIDSHAHLFLEYYKEDIDSIISNANRSGVHCIIVPGTNLETSREAAELAERKKNIFACVGYHPHDAVKATDAGLNEIEEFTGNSKVVAIGEIGLDYHYDFSPREKQRDVFAAQLKIAVKRNLPVVVHTRESIKDALEIVKNTIDNNPGWRADGSGCRRGVFHCYSGSEHEAALLQDMGFYISYPGIITFKNAESAHTLKKIGMDKLLLETDSPYMSPVPLRGKRNEPANIILIAKKIAEVFNVTEEEVAKVTSNNTIDLFKLPAL